jgi:hypothetical protein
MTCNDMHKGRQGKVQRQATKGTKADKERHKGKEENEQRQARKGTYTGKKWLKGGQGKT